jgi:hypothetical protein
MLHVVKGNVLIGGALSEDLRVVKALDHKQVALRR